MGTSCDGRAPASEVSACALSQSSDFASGKKCEGGVLQTQKKPRRNTYRGFFPMSMRPGPPLTQAQKHYHPGGRLQSSKKPVVPNHSLDVRYWHIADIDADAEHVRFWG